MASLSPDDKSTLVMVYTQDMVVRGEVVTKQGVRVSTWLRTQGVPEYIHLFKPNLLQFGSGAVKSLAYAEIYVPVATVIAFHLVPPVTEELDYSADETNRVMVPATALPGTFLFKGFFRISEVASLSTSLELAHSSWLTIYNVDVTNPSMPQMPPIHVPMVLVDPKQISIAVES